LALLEGVTVIALEASWTPTFTIRDDFRPEASVAPFLAAFCQDQGARFLCRQLRTPSDLECWCAALHGAPLKAKVLYVAGHGVSGGRRVVHISMPDHRHPVAGNRITPSLLQTELQRSGAVGAVIDTCSFARNDPSAWLPKSGALKWALAYSKSVDYLASIFLGCKVIEFVMRDRLGPPTSGKAAWARYKNGLKTGREKRIRDRLSYVALAAGLGAKFYYRDASSANGWAVCRAEEFA
jgi:hypothetical protein